MKKTTSKKIGKASVMSTKPVKKPAVKKTTAAESKKIQKEKSGDKRPTLESIIQSAEVAFTSLSRNYMLLGEAYVKAITYYGYDGKRAFRTRFPLTDNAFRNLELVGRGRLLPQFAMCSDKFVSGIVHMENSMAWQYKLLGASEFGKLRMRVGDTIRDVSFDEFRSGTTDAVLSIISKENVGLTPDQLRQKLLNLNREVRSRFVKDNKPPFEIRMVEGKRVVRFMKAKTYSVEDLKKIIAKLES